MIDFSSKWRSELKKEVKNTDISEIKMVERYCKGCSLKFRVKKDSPTVFHSRRCSDFHGETKPLKNMGA